MLANLLIAFGVITGIIGILDGIILSDGQKKKLVNFALVAWNSLDDIRRGLLLSFLDRKIVRIIAILGGVLYPTYISISSFLFDQTITVHIVGGGDIKAPRSATADDFLHEWPFFAFDAAVFGTSALLANFFIRKLLGSRSKVRFSTASIFIILSYYMVAHILRWASISIVRPRYPDSSLDYVATISDVLFYVIGYIIVFPFFVFYVAFFGVYILEVLTRKIAEQPKGPLAALSALVTGVGAILKVFA